MSLFLTLPISGQGTITDVDTARALPSVMGDPFGFTDVFMYSHGWWTSAESAMIDYNSFLGRRLRGSSLAWGALWVIPRRRRWGSACTGRRS